MSKKHPLSDLNPIHVYKLGHMVLRKNPHLRDEGALTVLVLILQMKRHVDLAGPKRSSLSPIRLAVGFRNRKGIAKHMWGVVKVVGREEKKCAFLAQTKVFIPAELCDTS